MKEIIEKIVRKSNREEHLRNEDQEGRTYSESIRVKEKESRRIPIIQLGAIENKTAINISDQKLKKVFGSRANSRARAK